MLIFILATIIILCIFLSTSRLYLCRAYENEWLRSVPIAHRGYNVSVNGDNSLLAFKSAIQRGYAIELDLRYTKDRVPMVIHDNDLLRTAAVEKKLSKLTFEEARQICLTSTGEPIPSFEEVLNLVHGQVPLLIEIKSYHIPDQFEDNIIHLLKAYSGQFAIQSYNPLACKYIKDRCPDFCVGLLLNDILPFANKYSRIFKDNLFTLVCFPNFITYNSEKINEGDLDIYREKGLITLGFIYSEADIGHDSYRGKVDNIIFDGG